MLDPPDENFPSQEGGSKLKWSEPKVILATVPLTGTQSFVSPVEHHGSGTTVIGPVAS